MEEAKQIPLDSCNPEQQVVLVKCINKLELTEDEKELLKKTLAKYRDAINNIKPNEILENYEHNEEYVKAEKTFLELLQENNKERTLTMNYPLNNGQIHKLRLKISKLESQGVKDIQTNLGMFQDFTDEENRVRIKQQRGKQLSREETILMEHVNRKLQEKLAENQMEVMVEFLATHTRMIDEPSDYEYMKQVYATMEFGYLEVLFERASAIAGLINPDIDSLFQ